MIFFLDTYTCKFDEIRQIQEFVNSFVKRFTMKWTKAQSDELIGFESVMEKRTCILRYCHYKQTKTLIYYSYYLLLNKIVKFSFWTLLTKLIQEGYAEDVINPNKFHLHETIIPLIVEPLRQSSLKAVEKQEYFYAAIDLLKALKVI